MENKLYLSSGSKTQTGSAKEFNTDAMVDFTILDGHVFAVCDGHDGVNGHGALSSKLVTESIKKYFFNRSYKDMAAALTNAVAYANYSLFELATKDPKYQGIGSTLAILIYRGGKVFYAYAGDSRIYLVKNNELQLLTRDHLVTNDEAAKAEVSVLLGKNKDVRFGVCKNPLIAEPDDLFLLCTDGLTDVVSDSEILNLLNDKNTSAEHKSLHLIEKVQSLNGIGDASVQVIEFTQAAEIIKEKRSVNLKPIIIVGLIVLLLGAFSYFGYKFYPDMVAHNELPETVQGDESESAAEETAETIRNETASESEVSYPDDISEGNELEQTESVKSEEVTKAVQKKESKPKAKQETSTVQKQQTGILEHTIHAGENLYRLGLRYHVPQQAIIDLNGTTATKLVTGQKLKIPITAMHKVAAGDTFKSLSAKYKVLVKHIKSANKMEEENTLVLDQELVIPLP